MNTPQCRLSPQITLGLLTLFASAQIWFLGCGGEPPIHASQIQTPSEGTSPTPASDVYDDSRWRGSLVVEEPWLSADTTLYIQLGEGVGNETDVNIWHDGGVVIADGTDIPAEAAITMEGQFLYANTQLVAYVENSQHSLSLDTDLSLLEMSGYLVVDGQGEIFIKLQRVQ